MTDVKVMKWARGENLTHTGGDVTQDQELGEVLSEWQEKRHQLEKLFLKT